MQDTAARYRRFATQESTDSPSYARLAAAVAKDAALLGRLDTLPVAKRQPNLYFGAVRYLGGPDGDAAAFRAFSVDRWDDVAAVMRARRTQTNEVGRCAALLPLLARIDGPVALLEIGASAGLCLYPDRYRYRYGDHLVGPADSAVEIPCEVTGPVPLPRRMPRVVWRAGLDLNPLDVADEDTLRWLEALVWPEHADRLARLRGAAAAVRADPPRLVRGDLLTDVPALAASAPADATLVVYHMAALVYVEPVRRREEFARTVRALPGHWVSQEGPAVLPSLLPGGADEAWSRMVLAWDGVPVASAHPHGRALHWR
ncbi:hypothetical protein GCM10010124_39290 [Pilimelia terevasa]|uniref:DUF2332 domain-containing protein n=1 Tax=Pilimelia terevasa TaxID=53372 RepID=A0A8J3BU87_9ACTN|nr:DUF2332 domain-containing protein [Pilimelia terevasa]GGK42561.1 hypothetical protein GCM10010124_39290 [Pilimelia terevasa]